MEVSPLRALTHFFPLSLNCFGSPVEMEVSPLRALTHPLITDSGWYDTVEMEVSPLRALTQLYMKFPLRLLLCRNGSKPVEGIDTLQL